MCAHGAPIWDVLDEGDVNVRAAPMSHGVPTVGFVIKEENRPGRLKPELVAPVIERNIPALKEAGVKSPMKIMSVIKNLPPDGAFNFPDGTVIKATDVVEPPREGRKVVILGDTACTRAIESKCIFCLKNVELFLQHFLPNPMHLNVFLFLNFGRPLSKCRCDCS